MSNKNKKYRNNLITEIGFKRYMHLKRRNKKINNEDVNFVKSSFQYSSLSAKHLYQIPFFEFLLKKNFILHCDDSQLLVPSSLSFKDNFNETVAFFSKINFHLSKYLNNTKLDFVNCKYVDISSLSLINLFISNFYLFKRNFNQKEYNLVNKEIEVFPSDHLNTNKCLYASKLIGNFPGMNEINNSSFLATEPIINYKSRSSFFENKKGDTCKKIQKFINSSLKATDLCLKKEGEGIIENLLGEILGNAEDHSQLQFYLINGISFKEIIEETSEPIIELNLSIINFGFSIYEGFYKNEKLNHEISFKMERLFKIHESQKFINNHHSKDSLYTLYALQEGVSRLKYKEQSRGNGTMNFIKAFMTLGEIGASNERYKPTLQIISGCVLLECTNEFKPYVKINKKPNEPNHSILSLNSENDIKVLPNKKCIFAHSNYFPGTILQTKIFLNKKYFDKIISNEQN